MTIWILIAVYLFLQSYSRPSCHSNDHQFTRREVGVSDNCSEIIERNWIFIRLIERLEINSRYASRIVFFFSRFAGSNQPFTQTVLSQQILFLFALTLSSRFMGLFDFWVDFPTWQALQLRGRWREMKMKTCLDSVFRSLKFLSLIFRDILLSAKIENLYSFKVYLVIKHITMSTINSPQSNRKSYLIWRLDSCINK